MNHEKSYTNHQYINEIGYTCSRSLLSVSFNMVQYIFNKGYAGEIKRDTISCNTNSILLKKKKSTILPTYEDKMQKPVSLAIPYLYLSDRDPPGDQKIRSNHLIHFLKAMVIFLFIKTHLLCPLWNTIGSFLVKKNEIPLRKDVFIKVSLNSHVS